MPSGSIKKLCAAALLGSAEWSGVVAHPTAQLSVQGFDQINGAALSLRRLLSLKYIGLPVEMVGAIHSDRNVTRALFATTMARPAISAQGEKPPVIGKVVTMSASLVVRRSTNWKPSLQRGNHGASGWKDGDHHRRKSGYSR